MGAKHTPGPWWTDGYGNIQTHRGKLLLPGVILPMYESEEGEANQAFIVRAANCHAELLEALEWALPFTPNDGTIRTAAIASIRAAKGE